MTEAVGVGGEPFVELTLELPTAEQPGQLVMRGDVGEPRLCGFGCLSRGTFGVQASLLLRAMADAVTDVDEEHDDAVLGGGDMDLVPALPRFVEGLEDAGLAA